MIIPTQEWSIDDVMSGLLKEIQILDMSHQYSGRPSMHDSILPPTASFYTHTDRASHSRNSQQRKQPVCTFCKGNHKANNCNVIVDPKERLAIVKRDNLCFNCLAQHKASQCNSRFTCRECKKRHHSSLCRCFPADSRPPQATPQPLPVNQPTTTEQTSGLTTLASTPPTALYTSVCLLKTVIAEVSSYTTTAEGHILFDEGAQRSFITQQLADELHLKPTSHETISVSSFGAQVSPSRTLAVASMFVHALNGTRIQISVLIVPKLAAPIRNSVRAHLHAIPYLQQLPLAHPVTGDENFDISVLIGADHYWHFIQDHIVRGPGPTAVQSKLGYLLSGPLQLPQQAMTANLHVVIFHCTSQSLGKDMCLWNSESISTTDTHLNDTFLQQYMKTHIRVRPDGTYSLRFPWKENHPPLPSNFSVCSRRTRSMAHRLAKMPELLRQYGAIIVDQERKGFIERVPETDRTSRAHYIPHHPVRKESSTTPIRIVYDCSCKQSCGSPSLNDCLHAGPPFLNDLSAILLWFRQHNLAFTADIEKAFLHVFLDETDRDYTRFLWLSDPNNSYSSFVTYRFKVVLFGATSSPFMLNATLKFHLTQNTNATSEDLLHNLYVDNLVSGCDSEEAAIRYFTLSRSILSSAGFNLRSWSSNCSLLQTTASQHKVAEHNNPVKVLGMLWNTQIDSIQLSPCTVSPLAVTKREILRWSSTIFDPLGLISPVTISARLFLQQLWQDRIGWDTILSDDLRTRWKVIADAITGVTTLSFPRKYTTSLFTPHTFLHVFADASLKAYGAVAYIQQDQGSPSLVMSKSRAAPLKQLTLPRLELKAAVLAAKLSSFVKTSLNLDCAVQLWSDSQIVLHWIASHKQLQPFVNRRVEEIRAISSCWKYCPSAGNPADLLTRGITAEQLKSSDLWVHGPTWLPIQPAWPTWDPTEVLLACLELGCADHMHSDQTESSEGLPATIARIVDINNYSNLSKLLAVTAYVLRFTNNTKHNPPTQPCIYRQ